MLPFYEKKTNTNRIYTFSNQTFPAHLHQEIELILVLDGCLRMTIENKEYCLTEQMIGVAFPHAVHSYRFDESYTALLFIIDYDIVTEMASLFANYLPKQPIIYTPKADLVHLLHNVVEIHQKNQATDIHLLRGSWHLIFAYICQALQLMPRKQPDQIPLVHQVLDYISAHFTEPLSLKYLSHTIGCNEYTISKLFSQKIGISFPMYLAKLRIDYAKNLLETSRESILTIALDAGFENTRSFNRHFLRLEGITPSTYRNTYLTRNKISFPQE